MQTNQEEVLRRVDISADISDIVYEYEKAYNTALRTGKTPEDAQKKCTEVDSK